MSSNRPLRILVVAVLGAQITALFLRAIIERRLIAGSAPADFAADLSYVAVPFALAVLLFPVFRENRYLLRSRLDIRRLTLELIASAIAIGVLARLAWWSQLLVRVSFGLTAGADSDTAVGPVFACACPSPLTMVVALLVWMCLVPVTEEVLNRGFLQSWFLPYGRCVAVLASSLLFALLHTPAAMPLAFVMGIVFALQFATTRTLWAPIIAHATYDTLVILDWRCLRVSWNPPPGDLPMLVPGLTAVCVLLSSVAALTCLLRSSGPGRATHPGPGS